MTDWLGFLVNANILKFINRWLRLDCRCDWLLSRLKAYPFINAVVGTMIVWLVVGFIGVKLDPFGLGRATDVYSDLMINRIVSPFYESEGQDEIAVVLIDQDTLEAEGIGWPPYYDYYSRILYRIMRHNPKAIFVDILLEEERPAALESLAYARNDLAEHAMAFGIPIIFAQSHAGVGNLFSSVPGVSSALSGWVGADYPLMVADETESGQLDAASFHPTVAMRLYEIARPAEVAFHPPMENLVVQWGSASPALAREKDLLPGSSYDFCDPNWLERVGKSLEFLKFSVLTGLDEGVFDRNRIQCPYILTVQAHDLASKKVRGLLDGRIVLVGVNVNGINDKVETPVNGVLPGVFQHAMALDNLLKYGNNYYTNPPFHGWLFILLAVLMSVITTMMVRKSIPGWKVQILSVGIIFLVCSILYLWFHLAPQNWIGFILICTLTNKMQNDDESINNNMG